MQALGCIYTQYLATLPQIVKSDGGKIWGERQSDHLCTKIVVNQLLMPSPKLFAATTGRLRLLVLLRFKAVAQLILRLVLVDR